MFGALVDGGPVGFGAAVPALAPGGPAGLLAAAGVLAAVEAAAAGLLAGAAVAAVLMAAGAAPPPVDEDLNLLTHLLESVASEPAAGARAGPARTLLRELGVPLPRAEDRATETRD